MHTDKYYMNKAFLEAKKAFQEDEVPVGAIIVKNDKIIARAHNVKEKRKLSTSHAEIEVINKASKKLNTWHLDDCILYVTLEPCAMCAGAIIQARIKKVVYGAKDNRFGAIESLFEMYEIKGFNHYPETYYFEKKPECGEILTSYFKSKR